MTDNIEAIQAVLFDLDGTLLDTAPDITQAINKTLKHHGFDIVTQHTVAMGISHGTAGIFKKILDDSVSRQKHEQLLEYFLEAYQNQTTQHTSLFDGFNELFEYLTHNNIRWGVVTNKSERFTLPILKDMNLHHLAACVICGDSTPHRKPHPAPVLMACDHLDLKPAQTLFFGDHEKDIIAGQAAGTCTAFAKYGYIDIDETFSTAAHHTAEHPMQLADIINQLNGH